ncbi:IclR family transcriptional regulator [Streptomyces sp. me109]|uniref:IclR family transcriptional regulator n=1 Tax=Streptomyces sp. me109 TaxID=1827853 RepID=UPI0011CE8E37|nr:helix-turn-helix domain-containing protein [Streptomyces sp. me109]TXS75150.1 IclR family transcriptional regulator [Streptomyces sp. me109]
MEQGFGQSFEQLRGTGEALREEGGVPGGRQGGRGVLEGAFQVMTVLDRAGQAGLTSLAAKSGLPRSTGYRLLGQLAELGAVERQADVYRLGPRLFRLGQGWQPYPELRTAAREPVRRLVSATGATVGVTVLREGRTLVLDWAAGQDTALAPLLDVASWPWFTAAGKVQAAGRPDPVLDAPASWHREAAAVRERSVAFDRGEVVDGVCCAAVPLLGAGGTAVGALCVLTTVSERLGPLADIAQRAAEAISARLQRRRAAATPPRPSLSRSPALPH